MNYELGRTTLGTLTYGYDLAGRRVSMGGSYAQTGLPVGVSSASYNADNQLTQWGTASLYYDANGNMTSDGVNAYAWNARNQLASMNFSSDSFQYDGYGRRAGKTISSATTNYLYDGANVVQELVSGTPTANLLSGGIDEVFQRTDSSGAANFLTDALGSTLALTDSSGSTLASYEYEPFGNTTVTSGSSANPYQYTGRENDGTGLYFNRARYYAAEIGRFGSGDPFDGYGVVNPYAYASDNPISRVDPTGNSDLVYNNANHTLTVYNGNGTVVGTYPAANNSASPTQPYVPTGFYSYSWYNPHSGDGPNSAYGSNGIFIFDVPGCNGCGVHSGRADRGGYTYPTDGCIRTTDAATQAIKGLVQGGDPLQNLLVLH